MKKRKDRLVECVCCGMLFLEDDNIEFSTDPICDYCSGYKFDRINIQDEGFTDEK